MIGPRTPGRTGGSRVSIRAWGALALLFVVSCSGPQPLEPPRQSDVVVLGHVVTWTSSAPTRGLVRFGRAAGAWDRVAYPAAVDREDLAYTTAHRIALLSVVAGDTVHLQPLDVDPSGRVTAGADVRALITSAVGGERLRWTMIDVGFGDAHLLELPDGRTVLVDAGERRDEDNVERFLDAAGVARLDVVVATHIHADHIGGLVGDPGSPDDGVIGSRSCGAFLDAETHSGSRTAYEELLATLARRAVPRAIVRPGDTDAGNAALAWDPAVRVEVLNAGGGRAIGGETESDWINNDSIVLRVSFGRVDLLLGADAESPVLARMLALGRPLESEILKVHHHGVSDASDPAYLDAVRPRAGLIPIATDESFDGTLPSGTVLERLRQRGVDVFTSDRAERLGIAPVAGAGYHATVVTDGASCEIRFVRSHSIHYPPDAPAAAPAREGRSP